MGQKRFSLEGAETVIALLDAVLAEAADERLDEVVIGMPHRGRLNRSGQSGGRLNVHPSAVMSTIVATRPERKGSPPRRLPKPSRSGHDT